jgi:hypothetical protein
MADALQAIRTEVADADVAETEKVLDDWKKVIGKNVRRNRAGKAKGQFANKVLSLSVSARPWQTF